VRPRLPLHLPFAGGPQPDHSDWRKTSRVTSSGRPARATALAFERREHSIRADLGLLKEARDFGERAAVELGLPDYARYQVRLALSEAVTNAIQHGSSSPDASIRICAMGEPGALVLEVIDTGRFVPRVTRRGEMPESGRGLEFMRLMMDEVELQPRSDGTRLRLVKRLE
jgi:anti-sigma regulatory factor (Ser/Thr protein kinase)